jgi:hypothetical protein
LSYNYNITVKTLYFNILMIPGILLTNPLTL